MNNKKLLSVCIPTYEMHGLGDIFLRQSFEILTKQTFKDFDVVISDYSKDNKVKDVCENFKNQLDIKYFKNENPVVGMSLNINNSIRHATGKIIKLLFQDDFLKDDVSLEKTVKSFNLEKDTWLISACEHTKNGKKFFRPHLARYNKKIHLGKNSIGSPSVLTIKNENPLTFDTNLKWFVDCDYYKRCYDAFGEPKILDEITVVIRTGEHQVTNTEINESVKKSEFEYVAKKFGEKTTKDITLVSVSSFDPKGALNALELSMRGMEYCDVVLISHTKPENLNPKITFKQCKPHELQSKDPKNKNDYSKFIAYNLCDYIESEYALIVHNDAYVLRPEKWDYEFLDYDYIGAPWKKNVHFTNEGVNVRVGNGGFSLRSKKMLNALNVLKLPFTDNGTGFFNEDGIICVYYRKKLEEYGIKFAPVPLASKFSHEANCDDSDPEPFGFHDNKKVIPKKRPLRSFLKKIYRTIKK